MDLQVARDPFLRALQLVQNIVEPRQTLPILANVLLDAQEGGLHVAATDLEVGVRVAVPATVARPGAITLAARKLVELVRELPAQPITIKLQDNGWVQLLCGPAAFRLVGLPAEEYPPLDLDAVAGTLSVEAGLLQRLRGGAVAPGDLGTVRRLLRGFVLVPLPDRYSAEAPTEARSVIEPR